MKKTFKDVISSITYNFKSLLIFELIYRALGLALIFPLARLLFILSIRLSGVSYITNTSLISYLLKPMTLLILSIILIILSIYMVIELIFLSVIFDYGFHQKDLSLKMILCIGLKKVYETTIHYRLRIIGPAFLFFILVELFHVVGIASTINLPPEILEKINDNLWLQMAFVGVIVCVCFLFLESVFTINHCVIEKLSTQKAIIESRRMLKGKRIQKIVQFVLLNLILNGILYIFYVTLIFVVSIVVSITRGEPYVLSFVVTIFYSLYSLIALLSTLILLPANYALISSWYYAEKERLGIMITSTRSQSKVVPFFSKLWMKRLVVMGLMSLFVINFVNVISIMGSNRSSLEFFNVAEIVAHRGASWDAPENTIAAIELAIIQGADIVEIDVRETSDLIPILMHDATTFRTTNDPLRRRVNNMTVDQLKALDAGTWYSTEYSGETIPTLEEALLITKDRIRVFIELKVNSATLNQSVMDLVIEMGLENDVVILSFDKDQLISIKNNYPEIQTLLLLSSFYGDINTLAKQSQLDMFGFSESLFLNHPDYKESIHSHQKKVYVWTVNQEENIRNVVNLDADGIITDRPVLAREIAYTKNASELLFSILNRFFKTDTQ